jgi:hypothetical protein
LRTERQELSGPYVRIIESQRSLSGIVGDRELRAERQGQLSDQRDWRTLLENARASGA